MWRKWFPPGLWAKELRQVRLMMWAMLVMGLFVLPIPHMNKWLLDSSDQVEAALTFIQAHGMDYDEYSFISLRVILCLLAAILAIWQLGFERRSGIQEFTLSLPYSRIQIFTTKFLVGVSFITIAVLVNVIMDVVVLSTSVVQPYLQWGSYINKAIVCLLVVYSAYAVSLFIGTISGSWVSQLVFSFVMLLVPYFLVLQFQKLISAFGILHDSYYQIENFLPDINKWLVDYYENYSWFSLLLLTLLALVGGLYAYSRNRAENNGKLVIFPVWETVLKIGFTLCVALLGGSFCYESIYRGRIGYTVGFAVAGLIGYVIIKTLSRMKIKL
ncbi:ABC transporter permease subunit [Paenibacillus sp. UMB4589-SE434]|uniref:ABC transporter permease subunit n=1 Tax=Paenibacillus sp. UMB4589-SE434 TaxID=3046314 RepID=UPI0025512DA8|nr:ABC transporter permease subunit [Paenibacillus sp. UMB4589-SE434]MDK8182792.1 ABC transporter permease subunit [Paenibacillus sp. UMB4589-SE434]